MIKRIGTTVLAVFIMNLGTFAFSGPVHGNKDVEAIEKTKSQIAKLGTGPDAKVEVKLKDGSKVKGYIGKANSDRFVVIDAKSGISTPVTYPQVQRAKGHNTKLGIIIAIGVVAVILIFAAIAGRSS